MLRVSKGIQLLATNLNKQQCQHLEQSPNEERNPVHIIEVRNCCQRRIKQQIHLGDKFWTEKLKCKIYNLTQVCVCVYGLSVYTL
jgi:hypothetical protein